MIRWATSIVVSRTDRDGTLQIDHCACVIVASNLDEATGKSLRVALKLYPPSDGWGRHHTVSQNVAIELEDPAMARWEPKEKP